MCVLALIDRAPKNVIQGFLASAWRHKLTQCVHDALPSSIAHLDPVSANARQVRTNIQPHALATLQATLASNQSSNQPTKLDYLSKR